ncbi:MAG: hypothetical protein DHS20C15_22360 [Planctomycetota bacterium]|nr:MAG: hypothetical protein DHS20C15_22360 [Planctomycetota bacterium]
MARRRRSNNSNNSNSKKLLINARESEESRIAVLQGGTLEEYYIERESLGSTLGNIYKARITNVEKSIGAAFVDFGHSRQGFLHVSDLSMAAVGDEAAELLAGVQAAREVAHEEDVVEPRKKSTDGADSADPEAQGSADSDDDPKATEAASSAESAQDPVGEAASADGEEAGEATEASSLDGAPGGQAAAASDDRDPDPDVADATATADGDSTEDDDEDDPAYTPDEEESDASVWSGTVSGSERGAQLKSLDQSDDDDDEHEPEVAELIGEGDDDGDNDGDNDGESNASADTDTDTDTSDNPSVESAPAGADPSATEHSDARADAGAESDASDSQDAASDDDDEQPILLEIHGPLPSEGHEAARAELAAAVSAEHRARSRGRRRGRRRGRGRGGRSEDSNASSASENGSSSASANGAAMETEPEEGNQERTRGKRGRRGGRPRGGKREVRSMPAIEDILQKGQEIVVQVIKDGIGTKGPTLTTYLSIPGRFIVLMPGINKRGVSRKVTDQKERERLKAIVRDLEAPEPLGFIVRTAGAGASKEDLERDLAYLISLYEDMQGRTKDHRAPVMLYQENDLVIRTLRDLYDGQGEIVIDHQETADKARTFLKQIMPQCLDKVQAYTDTKPIFSHYGLEAELTRLLKSRLELKSGASLIIEQTEALVAIDVNSGRYKPEKHKDIDETGFQVNCEAAVEIARQIRLRDMGGVVVIDFIDMRQEKHRKHLERLFKDELRKDRARIKVARFSPFGILEMTRQRVRPSLKRTVHQSCPYCDATGYIPSDETSCLSVVRKIRENLWRPGAVLVVTVRPEVAEAIVNTQRRALVQLEDEGKKQIFIRADHRLAYEEVDLKAMITLPDEVDHRRA